jgi:hypothetical protein
LARLEGAEIILLYHSREGYRPLPENRNILTRLGTSEIRVENKYSTVTAASIGCWAGGHVSFAKTEEGLKYSHFEKKVNLGGYWFQIKVR